MENDIIDAENYRDLGEGLTIKEVAMRQFQRVVNNMSQEMRKGFWIKSQQPNMTPVNLKYIGDSRRELRQSLDTLHDILQPKFDDEMKKHSKELYEEYNEWKLKWNNKQVSSEEEGNYWDTTLEIYRRLFQQLCFFLERFGWLESSGIEE